MIASAEVRIAVGERGDVSGLLVRPDGARLLYVLAHGAGAGMRHPFLEVVAQRLAERSIATLRYQFPYMEQRGRRPDPPAVAAATVRAAVIEAARVAPGLPLVAGGKRSEEHTSELQSRVHLVCRLLLGKKKKREHSCTQRRWSTRDN